MTRGSTVLRWLAVAGALLFAGAASAQTGSVAGTVTDASTNEPLSGVQISISNTGLGTLTGDDGRFIIRQVPTGRQVVRVDMIGYTQYTRRINVTADEVTNISITLESEAIALDEIVVTGVVGATQRAKVPFEVAQLRTQDLVVPHVDPASSIQGKVAGAQVVSGSGRPGSAPSILLRGPTSINASGRNQEPLYIVDGVILGSSLSDIASLDIESIEIVKGAAAASLYGSRAANGVVQITTKRGQAVPDNDVRYTVRSEYGESSLGKSPDLLLTEQHQYALTDVGGLFIESSTGQPCEWLECTDPMLAGQEANPPGPDGVYGTADDVPPSAWNTYQTQNWPGATYNQVERFFTPGTFNQNYIGVEGRSGATNFHISMSNLQEAGVMPGQEGFTRTGFRVNVDQSIMEDLQVSGSAYYSRAESDLFPESQGNPLFDLTRMPAGVDLKARNEQGELILTVDPTQNESPNPLYRMLNWSYTQDRSRFLGASNLQWSAMDWLRIDGNMSYDRSDREVESLYPKGYRTISPNQALNDGQMDVDNTLSEAINASITATMNFQLSDDLVNSTQLRYLYEQQDYYNVGTGGSQFAVANVPVLGNLDQQTVSSNSTIRKVLADGYFAITNFEFADRYVVDALVRNDGSSLFGEDERRQWYYRVAGAWRMAMEPWFPFEAVDEFKLRYSLGTAGGRPNFYAQYETYSVGGGRVSPVTLGNKDLKPEYSVEQEIGLDAVLFQGRMLFGATYAQSETSDQILPVPLPAYSGFGTQWRNVGTLSNSTFELSLQANLIQRRGLNWSARFIYDATNSEITELTAPPFTYGVAGQGLGNVFYAREGEQFGTFYGVNYATSCADLPEDMSCDGFTVDQNGWLVYVGNNSFSDPAWGASSGDDGVLVRGAGVPWGTPFAGECTDRATDERTLFCPVGNSIPDYNMALSSTLTWGGLSLYGLLDSSQGFDVYNQPLQWGLFKRFAGIMDQTGVSAEDKKPIGYWDALYGVSGLQPSNAFVEDASFIKLRELSASYRFDAEALSGIPGLQRFSSISLNLTGRNLITWTDYRGYDPEVGKDGGNTGSAAIARVEGYQYPNFRTWTAGLELVF